MLTKNTNLKSIRLIPNKQQGFEDHPQMYFLNAIKVVTWHCFPFGSEEWKSWPLESIIMIYSQF